mgnify:CR=1 FL=1
MVHFIELTDRHYKTIYINPQMIGDIYTHIESGQYGGEKEGRKITIVGCLTHNNGGFKVLDTPEEVLEKINKYNNEIISSTNN